MAKKPQRNSNSYSSTVTTPIIPIPNPKMPYYNFLNCTFIKKDDGTLCIYVAFFIYSVYTPFCQYFHHLNLQCCRRPIDDDYLTSNSKEFICFSLGLSGSESLPNIFLAHLWDFLYKFF